MNRFGRALGSALVGALLAGAYLIGISLGAGPDEVGPEPLRLGAYCRHLYGTRADGYEPEDLNGWQCSVWRNGVFGLEEVDLTEACRWQAGPGAQPETREEGSEGNGRLICTI